MTKARNDRRSRLNKRRHLSESTHGLVGIWRDLYTQHHYVDELVNSGETPKPIHLQYNINLRKFFKECQHDNYIPNKEVIEEKCQSIWATTCFGSSHPQAIGLDVNRIREGIILCKHQTYVNEFDSRSSHRYQLVLFLIINRAALSVQDIELFNECFNAPTTNNKQYLALEVLHLPMHTVPSNQYVLSRLVPFAKRQALLMLHDYLKINRPTISLPGDFGRMARMKHALNRWLL